jgi:hypothetical protein
MKIENPANPSAGSFIWVATAVTSCGIGLMLASLASLRSNDQGFYFVWNLWVLLAFLTGVGLGVFYWVSAIKLSGLEEVDPARAKKKQQTFKLVTVLLGFVALFAFMYPMKFVRPEKRDDVRNGLIMVPFFVIPALTGWYLAKRFLEKDESDNDVNEAASASPEQRPARRLEGSTD